MPDVITDGETGEDIYLGDLLVGLPYLPQRQRQAFVLICLEGYTETDARDVLLPNSRSSTPVQQYADSGLGRMVDFYDAKQSGNWPPPAPTIRKPTLCDEWRSVLMAVHPIVKNHLESARKDILSQIEGLKIALTQVETMLGARTNPAPTPRPEGRPDVKEAAKELAATAAG